MNRELKLLFLSLASDYHRQSWDHARESWGHPSPPDLAFWDLLGILADACADAQEGGLEGALRWMHANRKMPRASLDGYRWTWGRSGRAPCPVWYLPESVFEFLPQRSDGRGDPFRNFASLQEAVAALAECFSPF